MNVYRIAVTLSGIAFVTAGSAEAAREKVQEIKGKIVNFSSKEIAVSAADFLSPDLPPVSLSPAGVCMGPATPDQPELVHLGDI